MTTRTRVAAMLAAAGLGLGAVAAAEAARTNEAKTTINVGIDIPFHPIFNYVAANKDTYFAGKPYTVNFKILDGTTQTPAFGRGDLDVLTTPPSAIPRVQKQYKLDVAEFFPLARWTPGPMILVKADSPVKSIADLKGKSLAIEPLKTRFGSEEAAIEAATGQNIRTYFKLRETATAAQQLTLGRVDAAFIEIPAYQLLGQKGKYRVVFSVQQAFRKAFGDPAVVNGGYIARKDFIKDNPDFVKTLVSASQDAWKLYQRDPAKVNKVASKFGKIDVPTLEFVGQVLQLKTMPAAQRRITKRDVATWSKIFPLLKKSGFNQTTPADVPSLFVVTK